MGFPRLFGEYQFRGRGGNARRRWASLTNSCIAHQAPYYGVWGTEMVIAIVVGTLIGFVTGVATLITVAQYSQVLKLLSISPPNGITAFTAITTHLLGFPLFWLGGPWLTTQVMQSIQFKDFALSYVVTLGISYFVTIGYPICRWVYWLGKTMGKDGE
jgi:hypothetical protein